MQVLRGQYVLISFIMSLSVMACQAPGPEIQPPQATVKPSLSPMPSSLPPASASAMPTPQASQTAPLQPTPTPFPLPTLSPHPLTVVAGTGEEGSQDGPALQASFTQINEMCLDPTDESLYILDEHKIRKLTAAGEVITVGGSEAGFQDGPVAQARFNTPRSCAVDDQGRVYIADYLNRRIRVLEAGVVTTLLGNDEAGFVDGDPSQARLALPQALALDGDKLYIGDLDRLRVWDQHQLQTLAESGGLPSHVYRSSGEYWGVLDKTLGLSSILDIALTQEGGILISQASQGLVYILPNKETYIYTLHNTEYANRSSKYASEKNAQDPIDAYRMSGVLGITTIPKTNKVLGSISYGVYRLFLDAKNKEASANSVTLVSKGYSQAIGNIYSGLVAKQDGTVYVATSKPNQILKFQVKLD